MEEYFDSAIQGVIKALAFVAIRKTLEDKEKTTPRPTKRKSGSKRKKEKRTS